MQMMMIFKNIYCLFIIKISKRLLIINKDKIIFFIQT